MRDTLEGMHDQKGINIHEDTLEEPKTDTTKGPNNVDSKGLNCQNCKKRTYINKQSPNLTEDATDAVYVNKGDLDDLVVQVPQVQGVQQSAGMLQADEKQPENDVSGRVSESRKCFQLETQFRDTSREHSTPVQDTQSTHTKHHQRDSTCTTVITDDELINDDEGKMEEGRARRRQSSPCKIWKPNASNDRKGAAAANGRELRKIRGLRWKDHNTRINQTIEGSYHCPHRRQNDGRRKKKQNKEETTSSSESDALQDTFINIMKQDDDEGNSIFQAMTQLDDEMIQEAMNKMRQAFDENREKFGMEKLSFEAVERLIHVNRNSAKQSIKAQQEKAMQTAERREEEVIRFKEEQKPIMIEKERQACERHEQEAVHGMGDSFAAMVQQQQTVIETMLNDEQDRPAILAQSIDERYYKKVENFTGEQAWRDWSFQFKATTRIVNEAAYYLIETAENEEKEINDALSLSEQHRSLSSEIFNILGSLITGEPLQILYTSGSSGFEAWRKLSKRYNERDVKKQQETNMKEMKIRFGRYHGRDCETIYQEDRSYCQWVLTVDTGNPAVIEFRNFIKARNEQWEEQCREQKRIELEERETRIEENRQAAETEAREKERIMKQIRRAEMENERLEETDDHNAKDNNDTMSEAKTDDFTTEETGNKARADYLAIEAKGNKVRTEEDSYRHEAAVGMIHEQREEFPFVRMVIDQRTETGIQTSETVQRVGEQWEKSMEEQQLVKTI